MTHPRIKAQNLIAILFFILALIYWSWEGFVICQLGLDVNLFRAFEETISFFLIHSSNDLVFPTPNVEKRNSRLNVNTGLFP